MLEGFEKKQYVSRTNGSETAILKSWDVNSDSEESEDEKLVIEVPADATLLSDDFCLSVKFLHVNLPSDCLGKAANPMADGDGFTWLQVIYFSSCIYLMFGHNCDGV